MIFLYAAILIRNKFRFYRQDYGISLKVEWYGYFNDRQLK